MPKAFSPEERAERLRHTLLSRLKMRHLALLQAVHRHRTLSRVALELRLSQPAITKALKEVEEIFLAQLFVRSRQGLVPTPTGEAVLHYALISLADMESTTDMLSAIDTGLAGRVRIGVTPHVPEALLDAAFTHLLGQTPRVAVMAKEGTTDELVAALGARELDCVIGRAYHESIDISITQEAIYEQLPCLVVPTNSRARLAKGALDWRRLAALDWIMPPRNSPMRRTFNAIFLGAGVQAPLPIVETQSLRSIESVLRREPNGITILARDVAAELTKSGSCATLPYELSWNLPPISFFVLQSGSKQPIVRALSLAIRQAATGLGPDASVR
ncbi:LysR substrate-binding domain-containing protein [Variovorax ginsengisoli]|uniref:LysR substrate-binding domain-containing protein n=1 Tax=Variovorax ginsengisoli TaxID=363844 RepID=A0ABT8SIF1_9BURK|nr:LysR substrate-binding domain-containing protein [Variovorax ginsengisoli]MDN8618943.1 LysR substrate-binding domain-containing protein [Variovorax ginsengisoli]MDO1538113.1 LysR substrate-binding domain-containing protein [Variovorax ginsengisoli]